MNGNGSDGLSRLLSAAADRLALQLEPDVMWAQGVHVCRRDGDTLRVERAGAVVVELAWPGVDLDLLT